ncbi:DUF418 domain-containing protein [Paenibacillus ehimensis]|uniref:DUF418 domain-containing protein n=1 Tax=Paenibacillus ehimensis TaxID=79264 RepID=UPI002DB75ABF|nr:DUF418 domain-containing protein [Paenibacillus ehimensis]MEC0209808.1 DUF418 domain-containing protein [Paenibacillus ehimensis]
MKPTSANERIVFLDIVRGIAILGILLVNMTFYSSSLQAIQMQIEQWPGIWDQAVKMLQRIFVDGKFMAMFSFLFGYGMILFKERAEQKGNRFGRLYARRLLALLVFGLIHGILIWFGDILVHYALLGFILLLFHKRRTRTLLIWAIALLLLLPAVLVATGAPATPKLSPETAARVQKMIARDQLIYGSGTFADIGRQRFGDWVMSFFNQITFYPQILGLFLLGAYFAKRRVLHDIRAHAGLLRKLCWWAGGFGLITNIAVVSLPDQPAFAGAKSLFTVLGVLLGSPLLGLGYIALVALWFKRSPQHSPLSLFAPVGRMAFTNYILQSLVCTLLFYGYGLGWYGKVGPAAGLLLALAVFGAQMVWSRLWFKRFSIGPLEWLWRGFTYWNNPSASATKSAG